jgi:hypothetical protein
MLVLRFTVQNPTSRVFNYSYSYIKFTAVDSGGVTREHVGDVAREVTNQTGTFPLNPGQKIDFTRPSGCGVWCCAQAHRASGL